MKRATARFTKLSAASLVLVLAGSASAQVDDAAKAVLLESQKAVSEIGGATYKVKKYGSGMLKELIDLSGDVKMMRPAGATAPMMMMAGRMKEPGKPDRKITVSNDGKMLYWLSTSDQVLYGRPITDSKAIEELSTAKEFSIIDLVNGQTFDSMTKLPNISKQGAETINGTLCDMIVGTTADGSRTFTYAIGVEDRLPRRVEMAASMGAGKDGKPATGTDGKPIEKIAMTTEISELKPAQFKADDFKIVLPEGYVSNIADAAASTSPAATANAPAPASLGPAVGSAIDFSIVDSTGKTHTPASLKGNVVVLQFFGTMFKASVASAATMQSVAGEFAGKPVAFVGLSCREPSDGAGAEFFKTNKLSYTLVPKADSAATAFNIKGFPSVVVLDKDGKVASFIQDASSKDTIAAAINAAMK
jgi:peroxiredoxin